MLEQGRRLADIMMPHVMKKTRELSKANRAQTKGRLVHYTTAEAALNIIRTKRFWMRNTNCMSDYSEMQHGLGILNSFFSDQSKKDAFTGALDDCMPGVASEAFTAFNNSWSDIRLNTYIAVTVWSMLTKRGPKRATFDVACLRRNYDSDRDCA